MNMFFPEVDKCKFYSVSSENDRQSLCLKMFPLLLVLGALFLCIYWALNSCYGYWKNRGVPHPPVSLFFGNLGPSLSLTKSLGQIYAEIYHNYPNLLYVGYYKIRKPGLVIRDPELIRNVCIKEFSSFHDNDIFVDEKEDPVSSKNPFALKGERWKVVKSEISPCFTAKKLKGMYPLVEDSARKLIEYLRNEPDAANQNGLEAKELAAKYNTEVVASCAFGLEGKSFEEEDPEFRRMGRKIFQPSVSFIVKSLLVAIFPGLSKILKIKFFSDEVVNYFKHIVLAALKYREENNVVRNDFLDFMTELKSKPRDYEFNDDDVVGHALSFFIDGFETSSSAISYILYELAVNSDVQDKLLMEVQETLQQNGGKFYYDKLNAMPYLDAVLCEGLRMHPPGMALLRQCTKTFTLPPPGGPGTGPDVTIDPETPVVIPVYGIHYDPRYFPDPECFNPDRFSEANRESITKGTYMPFGEGPRGCHGQRFGMLQMKMAIASLIHTFEVKINNKTRTPLELDPKHLLPHPKGGIWLNFHERKN